MLVDNPTLGRSRSASDVKSVFTDTTSKMTWSSHRDPDIAWVEDVLRSMPLKDDRVMPRELIQILSEQTDGIWSRLDFQQGPPPHRLVDKVGPPHSNYFTQQLLDISMQGGAAIERSPLPERYCNLS